MKKVRGSQSAWMIGDLVITKYSSGCLRSILLADSGIREQIQGNHQERGALNEAVYEEHLKVAGVAYDREKPVSQPIAGHNGTFFVGRIDYVVRDPSGDPTIVELKSTESYPVYNDVIRHGKYKLENLAQLISYMVAESCPRGRLIYTYYKLKKLSKVYEKTAERVFEVEVGDDGRIWVDWQQTGFTVHDQLRHREASAECINERKIWTRPYRWEEFDSPCKRCPFQETCNKYDAGDINSTDDFISDASQRLAKQNEQSPEIQPGEKLP